MTSPCSLALILLTFSSLVQTGLGNHLPHFLLSEGSSEILLRLKEGPENPAGKMIYTLKGYDPDGDPLTFGLRGPVANSLLRIEKMSDTEVQLHLKHELDREVEDEYMIILTLTDGKSEPVQQSLLLLVQDKNDNSPVFKPYESTIHVPENSDDKKKEILAVLEATDRDEGPYGQVVYRLRTEPGDESLFSLSNEKGKAVLKLMKPLDYEKKFLHQVQIIANDRAETSDQINEAVASLIIHVQDEEDMGPEFVAVPPVTRLREDTPVSSYVLQVQAIDGDRGVQNGISYKLLNNEELFGIDSESGIVFTKAVIDRENGHGASYILRIMATEESVVEPKPTTITETTIVITDVDDEKPQFKSPAYLGEIVENSPAGVPVTFLGAAIPQCYDHDMGVNGTFILSTRGDGGVFDVTPSQGINQVAFLIRVKNPMRLDYEQLREINFTLVAEAVTGDKSSTVPVSVKIIDTNDNNPKFEKEQYKVYLAENARPGTSVVKIQATDIDSGSYGTPGIRYTALTGTLSKQLKLDSVTGLVTVKNLKNESSLLDREMSPVYYLTVEAQDNGGTGNRNKASIEVHLIDENDNSPIFLQSRYEGRIFENERSFVSPLRVQAKDDDLQGTPNAAIHYSILSGNEENHLQINSRTGQIKVAKPIDFETLQDPSFHGGNVKKLNLTLRANDKGTPPKFSLAMLTLFVHDVNDYAPVFDKPMYEAAVREDLISGSRILRLTATDLDASAPFNTVFYRIESGAQDKFIIDPESGILRLAPGAFLDYNLAPSYMLDVFAIDGAGLRSEKPAKVNITIIDANNKPPRFPSAHMRAKVTENSKPGTLITKIEAVDPDSNAVLRYRIDFNESEARDENGRKVKLSISKMLAINEKTGELLVHGKIDRELVSTFKLSIKVIDSGSKRSEFARVSRVSTESSAKNRQRQRIRDKTQVEEPSNRNGNQRMLLGRYRRADKFQIREIRVPPNIDARPKPIQEAQMTLNIDVEDVNDNAPEWKENPYFGAVTENAKMGTVVLTLRAEDRDLEREIKYYLKYTQDIDKLPVDVGERSGVISVVKKIDREMTQWINFTVVAEDSGTNPGALRSEVGVHLRVIDENDNNPIFVDETTNLTISEDATIGTIVARLKAIDYDTGAYGKVTFLLDRKSSHGKFSVDPDTGEIRVAESLDREEMPTFALVVQAWDNFRFGFSTGESRNAFKQIDITLADVNDQVPYFVEDETRDIQGCSSVTEFHEDPIVTIRAKDDDDPRTPNGWVTFKIKSGNDLGLFQLEQQGPNVAKIVPAKSLKGFYGNYTLDIIAQDGGSPSNFATSWTHICVEDYNDHKPKFINPSQNFTIKVPENATLGTPIMQVRAIDSDIGQNGVVRYRFREDISSHWKSFDINKTTGVISLARLLDRERQKFYHLRVEAYDLGKPTPLSSELDLTVYVKNVDDFKPIFTVKEFVAEFTENSKAGYERIPLPETIDGDDEEDEEDSKRKEVCYFLLSNESSLVQPFFVHPTEHALYTTAALDRETQDEYYLHIFATDNCFWREDQERTLQWALRESAKSVLRVAIKVSDVDDNSPQFTQKVFTGGVSTSTPYGEEFMRVSANDVDTGLNAKLTYSIVPPINLSLSQGLSHLLHNDNSLFAIDSASGAISLAFDPQPDMKGHFVLSLEVRDPSGHRDSATALVYLLRDDQKVKVVARLSPAEVRNQSLHFTSTLSAVTGKIVNVDENFKFHENRDGSVDKTKTDFYIHLVSPEQNLVLEVEEALKLIDLNIEELDDLFKEFNVLDTQATTFNAITAAGQGRSETKNLVLAYAAGTALFLALVLIVVIFLCFAQRAKYQRQLKAATANAYGSSSTIVPRTGNVPNTNVHSVEGSNPIWMQAYHNSWYKEDSLSENSESRDSLDDHGLATECSSPPSSHMRSFLGSSSDDNEKSRGCNDLNRNNFHRNLIYTSNSARIESGGSGTPCLILKKHLETTEL